jgi:hypothetical protein
METNPSAGEGGGLLIPDRNTAERLEEARSRASTMLSLADVLEAEVGPEEIRRAALVPVSEVAERFVAMLAACARENFEAIARVLAGLGSDEGITFIMNKLDSMSLAPVRRPRRPRPTAAAERARRAAEWLAGPAWTIVDPDPNTSPDGGAP